MVALSIQNGSRPPPATRRAAAKNCMKFKVSVFTNLRELANYLFYIYIYSTD